MGSPDVLLAVILALVVAAGLFSSIFPWPSRSRASRRGLPEGGQEEKGDAFRSLVQNASGVILVMEPDGAVRYVNPAVERALGYTPELVVGELVFAVVHPDDVARVRETIAEAVGKPGTVVPLELRLRHTNG